MQWSGVKGKETCIEKFPHETLDVILQQFYTEICNSNVKDYEPNSFAAVQGLFGQIPQRMWI